MLGLPSDMEPPGSVELVRMAIDEPKRARLIAMVLAGHTPKEPPAGMLVAALDAGSIAPELGAELLGAVGHRSGYRTLRTMLFEPERASAAEAAAVAMARVLGPNATDDLLLALRAGPSREAREGAAWGLAELDDPHSAATIGEAGRDGRIRARVAARCIARLPFDPGEWLAQLQADDLAAKRLATEVVYVLVRQADERAQEQLDALGEAGRRAVRRVLEDEDLYLLPDKRDALESWVRHGRVSSSG